MHYSKVLNEMDLKERMDNFVDFLEDKEIEVLDSLCKSQDLSRVQIFRQMLRLYQLVTLGHCSLVYNNVLPKVINNRIITLHGHSVLEGQQRFVFNDQKIYCQIIDGQDIYFEIKDNNEAHLATRERATELGWGNYGEIYENN